MGWRDLAKNLKALDNMSAEVGWQAGTSYPDGTPTAAVARWLEKGNSRLGIGPGAFMQSTVKKKSAEWSAAAALGVKAVAVGTRTPEQVIDALGQLAAGEVRATIAGLGSYPDSDPVIQARRRKGVNSQKFYVATGLMITSCTSTVKKG